MEPRSLKYVADACGGELLHAAADTPVSRVCTDSRQAQPGDLFFALAGERFDGHDFLSEIAGNGIAAAVVSRAKVAPDFSGCPLIVVENPRQALGHLAARYRDDFNLPIIAVGGSNGKTTTKELIACVLRQRLETLWSEASFNNDVGVPLTLLKLEMSHEAAVLEVGTNHPGELAPLLQMIRPRYGVVTSVGREHLQFFGDLAGVVREEGTMAEGLPPDGALFVNADNPLMEQIIRRSPAPVVRVGFSDRSDVQARDVRMNASGVTFWVNSRRAGLDGKYAIQLLGRHQVSNALLAIAVGSELGLTREQIQRGLANCPPPKMRLQVWNFGGVTVLDDAYNANADSVLASLQTLREFPCPGRRVAVLGDMAELGDQTEDAHVEIGRSAAAFGLDVAVTIGSMAGETARAAREAGLEATFDFSDVEMAGRILEEFLKPGDVVLVKASRASRLERVVEHLRSTLAQTTTQ